MKILVLGSEGQIGRPFCKYARSAGHTVFGVDKKGNPNLGLDLSFPFDFRVLTDKIRSCDAIVFLAFEVGGSKFLEQTDKRFAYIAENVGIMQNVFAEIVGTGKPFIFASSQMANMHHTNYGFLKDLGERYTRSLDNGYICRFWNVYGYEDPQDPKSHVITDFIEMAKSKSLITMRTTGDEKRQFLHTDDCSKALLHWCENHSQYDPKEYIDITSFKWNSVLDVANIIKSYIPCLIEKGEKTDSIQRGILNDPSDYIVRSGFWKPEISLEEGIRRLL